MDITIVTIVYNGVHEIEKTIKSVLAQKNSNVEYVIIDGNSNDGTLDVINKYKDKIDVIISEKDNGIADAFNKGIQHASGDYIALINCGDTLEPNVLEGIRSVKEYSDVIYGDCIVHDVRNDRFYKKKAMDIDKMQYFLPFSHQACFVSKKAYEKYGLYESEYKICMDYALIRKMYAQEAKFTYIEIPMACFSTEGISYRKPIDTMIENMRIACHYGLPLYKATSYGTFHVLRYYIKKLLEKLGLFKFVVRFKNKKYKY